MDKWDNYSCLGYVLKAMKESGIDKAEIKKVISNMFFYFDEMTLQEACDYYESYNNEN